MSYYDEIAKTVAAVKNVRGVNATIFVDSSGEILDTKTDDKYQFNTQQDLIATIVKLQSNLSQLNCDHADLMYTYKDDRVVVYDIDPGYLVLLCSSALSLSLLHLTTKAPRKKLMDIMNTLNNG